MRDNRLVPTTYDVLAALTLLAATVLTLVALVLWFRDRRAGAHGLVELAGILLVPIVGAVAYLVARHREGPLGSVG